MDFCTITPVAGLERWGRALSRTHLVLANHLYSEAYLEWYVTARLAGDTLILDNGAYENTKPVDNAAYINFIKGLNPQVAVLPDFLKQPWLRTTSASLHFLDSYARTIEEHNYNTQWMYVPQFTPSEKIDSWYRSLDTVLNDGRVGRFVTWVGLGRYLASEEYGNVRVLLANHMKKVWPHIKVHALGMAAGNLKELPYLKEAGVKSIDSSCAVWRGWNGNYLTSPEHRNHWTQHGTPCDFYAPLPPPACQDAINSNLEAIRNAIV